MIRIKGVSKRLGNQEVLKNIDLEIADGEIFVIVGRSGAGKSVLLRHILGFHKPDAGEVFLDEAPISALEGPELYKALKRVSMIFQLNALFDSKTVGENVGFYLKEHRINPKTGEKITPSDMAILIEEALNSVGLKGIEDLQISDLSGGMKKRVAIARGVISEPRYIFYDEPTSGLDPVTADAIGDLIVEQQNAHPERTAIVVSHDIPITVGIADRIALIDEGEIQIVAPPHEFMQADNPIIAKFREIIGNDMSLIRGKRSG